VREIRLRRTLSSFPPNRAFSVASSAWAYQTSSAVFSANPAIERRYAATAASTMLRRCFAE
jgi:hypothetical protein